MFRQAIPVLHVTSSDKAQEFYKKLGFQEEFAYRPFGGNYPCYMGFARDDARLHASSFSGDAVCGGVVYLRVDDVDAVYRELMSKGVAIDTGPVDQDWGNREVYVRDPDGNSI